ncbi:MAG: hypothetical protein M5U25_11520 [Planctomycetota bacterium]|nr:hypothetical protein [Planctomycetota bacterium]
MMKLAPLILLCLLSSACGIVPQQAMAERQPGESEYWTEPRGRTDRIHNENSETVFNRSKLVYQGEHGSVYAPTIYIGGVDEWYTEYTPSPTPISAAFVQRLFRAESNIPGLVNCGLTDAEREEFAEPTAKALTEYGAAIILLKTQSVKFLDGTPTKDRVELFVSDDTAWVKQRRSINFASSNWAETLDQLKGEGKLLGVGVNVGAMWGYFVPAVDTTGPVQYCWWDLKGTHLRDLP